MAQRFWLVGSFATIIGIICFVFRDTLRSASSEQQKSRLTPVGWDAYKACFKDKNILLVSLVFMAGAAGRGQDINEVYIIPHFVHDFNISITYGAFLFTFIQVGSLIGPFVWGWISDRFDRKLVIQASLLMSALCTLWLAWQQHISTGLFVNLVIYGAAVTSRQTLTQALLADLVGEELFDAAFSLYYFIGFVSIPFWTRDYRRSHDEIWFRAGVHRDLDFLSPRHEPSGPAARTGKSTEAWLSPRTVKSQ